MWQVKARRILRRGNKKQTKDPQKELLSKVSREEEPLSSIINPK